MRRWVPAVLAATLCACSSPAAPEQTRPPDGFPDLANFAAVNTADHRIVGGSFVSPGQVWCVLAHGPNRSILCGGDIPGLPASVTGSGCPEVRKPENGPGDAAYVLSRPPGECVTARYVPMSPGHKLVRDTGTCAVGDNGLVACIDADNKHGFVLQSSGSWAF